MKVHMMLLATNLSAVSHQHRRLYAGVQLRADFRAPSRPALACPGRCEPQPHRVRRWPEGALGCWAVDLRQVAAAVQCCLQNACT